MPPVDNNYEAIEVRIQFNMELVYSNITVGNNKFKRLR